MKPIVLRGDARSLPLPDASVDLIVTSPPYFGLRSYTDGGEHYGGQIGSEATPGEWLATMVACTAEWVRVLKPSGSLFVNLGDKYAGSDPGRRDKESMQKLDHRMGRLGASQLDRAGTLVPPRPMTWGAPNKSLLGLPWRYAIAATDQLGLILRRDIIWHKPNGLPESVTDRCRSSHEYVFHLVRQPRYYAAVDEIREPHNPSTHTRGRNGAMARDGESLPTWGTDGTQSLRGVNKRYVDPDPLGKLPGSVWTIPSQPLTVPAHLGIDHFAAFPMELPRRCILGWSPPGVCTGCGEGRRPVVVGENVPRAQRSEQSQAFAANGAQAGRSGFTRDVRWMGERLTTITGYACACPQPTAPTRPAVVLDPFGGTGTTALVAAMHGRTGISIDRSWDYSRLAQWRTTDPGQRAAAMQVPKPPPQADGQADLFEGLMG